MKRSAAASAIAVHRDRAAVNDLALAAAEEQDYARYILRLGPLREICLRHRLAIGWRVDDARQNRVHAQPAAFELLREGVHEPDRSGFRRRVCRGTRWMVESGFGGDADDGTAMLFEHDGNDRA